MDDSFFRPLTSEEKMEFRLWARKNYKPGMTISSCWHPVVREECQTIADEQWKNNVAYTENYTN